MCPTEAYRHHSVVTSSQKKHVEKPVDWVAEQTLVPDGPSLGLGHSAGRSESSHDMLELHMMWSPYCTTCAFALSLCWWTCQGAAKNADWHLRTCLSEVHICQLMHINVRASTTSSACEDFFPLPSLHQQRLSHVSSDSSRQCKSLPALAAADTRHTFCWFAPGLGNLAVP